jgi:hypothetical protein
MIPAPWPNPLGLSPAIARARRSRHRTTSRRHAVHPLRLEYLEDRTLLDGDPPPMSRPAVADVIPAAIALDGDGELNTIMTDDETPSRVSVIDGGVDMDFEQQHPDPRLDPAADDRAGLDGDGTEADTTLSGDPLPGSQDDIPTGDRAISWMSATYAYDATNGGSAHTRHRLLSVDFNGDGRPDLATANGGSDDVSVLTGRGDGTFQDAVRFPVGAQPSSLVTADFDGDGRPDVATANSGSDDVSVLAGQGDGTFQTAFDGDGQADLATAHDGPDDVSVLTGQGDGTFQAADRFRVGGHPTFLVTADFDGDGRADLATANGGSDDVSILLGRGDGTFQDAGPVPVGVQPSSLVAADFDGDGRPDLAAANGGSGDVSVRTGRGDGTFRSQGHFPVGTHPSSLVAADFDGDGRADLATANGGSDDVSILLGRGDGTFQDAGPVAVGAQPSSLVAADFDGDGRPDLAIANDGSDDVSVLLGRGDGTFRDEGRFLVGAQPSSLVAADFDGDGRTDLVTAHDGLADVSVLLGVGDGTFRGGSGPFVGHIWAVADLNGDGKLDIVTGDESLSRVSVIYGSADTDFEQQRLDARLDPGAVRQADPDRDGIPDLIVADGVGNSVRVFVGRENGTFDHARSFTVSVHPVGLTLADVNDDGILDVIAAGHDSDDVTILLGHGQGDQWTLTHGPRIGGGGGPIYASLQDADGDGLVDLVVTDSLSDTVTILPGSGNGLFDGQSKKTFVFPRDEIREAALIGSGDLYYFIASARDSEQIIILALVPNTDGDSPVVGYWQNGDPAHLADPFDAGDFYSFRAKTHFDSELPEEDDHPNPAAPALTRTDDHPNPGAPALTRTDDHPEIGLALVGGAANRGNDLGIHVNFAMGLDPTFRGGGPDARPARLVADALVAIHTNLGQCFPSVADDLCQTLDLFVGVLRVAVRSGVAVVGAWLLPVRDAALVVFPEFGKPAGVTASGGVAVVGAWPSPVREAVLAMFPGTGGPAGGESHPVARMDLAPAPLPSPEPIDGPAERRRTRAYFSPWVITGYLRRWIRGWNPRHSSDLPGSTPGPVGFGLGPVPLAVHGLQVASPDGETPGRIETADDLPDGPGRIGSGPSTRRPLTIRSVRPLPVPQSPWRLRTTGRDARPAAVLVGSIPSTHLSIL